MNYEFEEIASKALAGDKEAVADILTRLRPLVIAYSSRYGGRQGMDEDFFQEGMLEVLEGLVDYDPGRGIPFLAYITTRIRYYYFNRRRKQKFHYSLEKPVRDGGISTFGDLLEDAECDIEGDYLKYETNEELKMAMEKLSHCQKEIVEEYYFGHKTLKKIALERGIHPVSVAKTKGLALRKLKKILETRY